MTVLERVAYADQVPYWTMYAGSGTPNDPWKGMLRLGKLNISDGNLQVWLGTDFGLPTNKRLVDMIGLMVRITSLTVTLITTGANAIDITPRWGQFHASATNGYVRWPTWTTTANQEEGHVWPYSVAWCMIEDEFGGYDNMDTLGPLILVIANAVGTEDISVYAEGEFWFVNPTTTIEKPTTPVPVNLDGYRWPLRRVT